MTPPLTREQVRDLCLSLGYDPDTVLNITIEPRHVEVTVLIPITDDEHPTPPNYTTQDGWIVDHDR